MVFPDYHPKIDAADDELKAQIANRLLVTSIDPGDFEKSSATVEYKWAHNDRGVAFLGWGSVAVVIMLYATDDVILQEPNLRFTLVG